MAGVIHSKKYSAFQMAAAIHSKKYSFIYTGRGFPFIKQKHSAVSLLTRCCRLFEKYNLATEPFTAIRSILFLWPVQWLAFSVQNFSLVVQMAAKLILL